MSRELDFERPVNELERQIDELRRQAAGRDTLANVVATPSAAQTPAGEAAPTFDEQIAALEAQARMLKEQIFSQLTRWQIVQLARHPQRPYTLDYVRNAFSDFVELHGDRGFGDDPSIVGGLARLQHRTVMVIGHQKGRTTNENLRRNFGMPRPEGYRKAMRLMRMAERFSIPIVTLIDTPGAYPGMGAEERGQAQAIAESLECMASLAVPVVTVVIGEGGSGGALAIGVANRLLMMAYGMYSVISPEGCASILFKDAAFAEKAADALRLTSPDLIELGVVDGTIEEPSGGAHRDPELAAKRLASAVSRELTQLAKMSPEELIQDRYDKFRKLGSLGTPAPPPVAKPDERPAIPRSKTQSKGIPDARTDAEAAALAPPVAPGETHKTGIDDSDNIKVRPGKK